GRRAARPDGDGRVGRIAGDVHQPHPHRAARRRARGGGAVRGPARAHGALVAPGARGRRGGSGDDAGERGGGGGAVGGSGGGGRWGGGGGLRGWVWMVRIGIVGRISGGRYHPPVGDDELSPGRRALCLAVAVAFVLLFTPVPMREAL